jgi:2-keto-3-deoxy-L-fuconate dehydrogenase
MQGPDVASEFQKEGAIIYLQSHDLQNAKRFFSKFDLDLTDRNMHLIEADFKSRGTADKWIDKIVVENGRLDVLVNNNWHEHRDKALLGIDEDDWDSIVLSLFTEVFYTSKAAIKHMVPRRDGKIINCTAAAAVVPYIGYPAYSSARFGCAGLTRALGKELAPYNIQVNAVAQNYVENPTYWPPEKLAKPETQTWIKNKVPIQRLAKGWEQARLVVFLASDDSDFICGEVIRFAGGAES